MSNFSRARFGQKLRSWRGTCAPQSERLGQWCTLDRRWTELYVSICMGLCVYIYIYTYMYLHLYIYIRVCVYIRIHKHIKTPPCSVFKTPFLGADVFVSVCVLLFCLL